MSRAFVAAPLLLLAALAGCGGGGLGTGDPAPPLAVSKWLRGDPVRTFKSGTTYVIECWASWCGPCRAVVPHLTSLQKKYPEVVFIGVNVWERDPAQGVAFVEKQGDRMGYRVAQDDLSDGSGQGRMATTWLKAAGRKGIPCAFVVDGTGTIAWIGHPMDPAMEKTIAGAGR